MLYRFKGNTIGDRSHDWYSFKLFRRLKDIKIRRYPNTIGISTAVLMDLVNHKTKIILIIIGDKCCFRTDPRTWLEHGIIDKLSPDQEPHAFLNLKHFYHYENASKMNLSPIQEEKGSLFSFL